MLRPHGRKARTGGSTAGAKALTGDRPARPELSHGSPVARESGACGLSQGSSQSPRGSNSRNAQRKPERSARPGILQGKSIRRGQMTSPRNRPQSQVADGRMAVVSSHNRCRRWDLGNRHRSAEVTCGPYFCITVIQIP